MYNSLCSTSIDLSKQTRINEKKSNLLFGSILILTICIALLCSWHNILSFHYDKLMSAIIKISVAQYSISFPILGIINKTLLAIFYYIVGVQLKNELLTYKNKQKKQLLIVACASVGGCIMPALIYMFINKFSLQSMQYCGLTMVSDTILVLSLCTFFKNKLSKELFVFIKLVVICEDIVEAIIISIYTVHNLNYVYLALVGILHVIAFCPKLSKKHHILLFLLQIVCLFMSGVNAVILGLVTAIIMPVSKNSMVAQRYDRLQDLSNFIILPLFIFFNLHISFDSSFFYDFLFMPQLYGISISMLFGKPIGITTFTYVIQHFSKIKLLALKDLLLAGIFCSIGLTSSLIFVYINNIELQNIKATIFLSSLISMILMSFLTFSKSKNTKNITCIDRMFCCAYMI